MASSCLLLVTLCSLLYFSHAHLLVLPVTKDPATLQYLTHIHHGTPLSSSPLVLDLSGSSIWLACSSVHHSSSRRPVSTRSIDCSSVTDSDHCSNKTCHLLAKNSFSNVVGKGELVRDTVAIADVHRLLFTCAAPLLLKGLTIGARGMLGLGRAPTSLPTQLDMSFDFDRTFLLCLSSSSSNGVIVFGQTHQISIIKSLTFTPLITKKNSVSEKEYYIRVKSMKINGKSFISSRDGDGIITKISTTIPYTTMESSIYTQFANDFINSASAMNMSRVAAVAPFALCFESRGIGVMKLGPAVPVIDLVLQSEMVKWRINGRNSMVKVSDDVMCLGIMDGGVEMEEGSIIIGGYQLEDVVVQIDRATSMLGFSSSLLMKGAACSDMRLDAVYRGSFGYKNQKMFSVLKCSNRSQYIEA